MHFNYFITIKKRCQIIYTTVHQAITKYIQKSIKTKKNKNELFLDNVSLKSHAKNQVLDPKRKKKLLTIR